MRNIRSLFPQNFKQPALISIPKATFDVLRSVIFDGWGHDQNGNTTRLISVILFKISRHNLGLKANLKYFSRYFSSLMST